ncbi:MAG TPA: hypothetical protein PKD55_24085 [Bellilinea sp.]|nr:hypothetical protein [Bellilinea sp.]
MTNDPIQNNSVLGLSPEEYDAAASQYSKNAIFLWCASSIAYIFLSDELRLLSLITLFTFLPGIFIASFASIPFFFASTKLKAKVAKLPLYPRSRAISVLASATLLFVIFTAVQIALPIAFIKFCAYFL